MSKTWFITGASRGIGAEIAKAALAAGERVIATGRNRAEIAKTYAAYGDQVLAVELDVTRQDHADAAVLASVARFGGIDVLVNNAGYGQLGAFDANLDADIQRQYETNVFGMFRVTRAVLPLMRTQRRGHIFNVSSVGGVIGYPFGSIYCSTKFAVEGFSESLAQEIAPFGIRLTIVEPGFFRTDFLDASSVHYGSGRIEDPELNRLASENRALFESRNHQQTGDPAKLGEALLRLVAEANPPLRYAAGSDAFEAVDGKLLAQRQELQTWRALSTSTDGDFPD